MNIWRVDLTSARLNDTAAFITSTRNEYHPSYSADGKSIAFESDRFGNEEIWVSDADGSKAVQVTSSGKAQAGSPTWSPDNQRIAFDSNAAGQWDIYVISSQGSRPNLFTSGSGSKIRPSWSHDGKWIYYCASGDNGLQIWKKPATGGRELQITKNGGCNQMESPDGRHLYYLSTGNRTLRRVPVDGGEEVQLTQLGAESQFTLGKYGLYFIASMDANTLKFLDYRTGSTKTLGTLPGHVIHGLAVSPDEHWLLYAKDESAGSHLMLVEKFR
jgi:Tol biopolymer transport system component